MAYNDFLMGDGSGGDDEFARWLETMQAPPQYEAPRLASPQPLSGMERMGMALSQVEPYRDKPYESGASAFLRALLTGTARGYGTSVQASLAERERRLKEQNEQEQARARAENQQRMLMYQMGPAYQNAVTARLKAMAPPEPPNPNEQLFPTPKSMREATGLEQATRANIISFINDRFSAGRGTSNTDAYTPKQKQQFSRVEREYDDRAGRLSRSLAALERKLGQYQYRPNDPAVGRINAEIDSLNAEYDKLSAWKNQRLDEIEGVKQEPTPAAKPAAASNEEPFQPKQFWSQQVQGAGSVSELAAIAETLKRLQPEVFADPAVRAAMKARRQALEVPSVSGLSPSLASTISAVPRR